MRMTAWLTKSAVVCSLITSSFYGVVAGIISFPVQLTSTQSRTFTLEDHEDPQTAIRKFCYEVFNSHERNCKSLVDYVVNLLSEQSGGVTQWISKEDDILYSESYPDVVAEWGGKHIKINLNPLSGVKQSALLVVPQFTTHITTEVEHFCTDYGLCGMACRALAFETQNLATALYFRDGGATLRNILQGMYFQQELEMMYFPVYMENPVTGQVTLHFFFTDIQYSVPSVCKFCLQHSLPRERCKMIADYTDKKMQQYYGGGYSGQLWALQYVLNSLQAIAQERSQLRPTEELHPQAGTVVTADFVEIGTSNFDTIIQLVDDADGFVGFSVEPSNHYLSSLPNKTGVTKVNCAIVKNLQASTGNMGSDTVHAAPQFVDLYYVPEEVINKLNLYYYLKGCNSIGGYHPGHIEHGVQQHVVVDKVPAMSITAFLRAHNIHRIRLLKVDAEGYDLTIMQELYLHIISKSAPIVRVDRIIFESNDDEQRSEIIELIRNYARLGYVQIMTGENTVLELKK